MSKKYRVLSLDGGGSWAMIQVRVLMDIYGAEATGHEVLKHFDMIAANSGGSLVAAGLIENLPLTQLYNFFLDKSIRQSIFSKLPWYANKLNPLNWVIHPKYSTKKKMQAILGVLPNKGPRNLNKISVPGLNGELKFIFMTYDYERDRSSFMRSWESNAGSVTSIFTPVTLAQAVHASTNAPIRYFDEPASFMVSTKMRRFWDGALSGYNNPVLASVVEAVSEGWNKNDIGVLSIGTANTMLPLIGQGQGESYLFKSPKKSNTINDLMKVSSTTVADPPDAHSFIAHVMLNGALPTSEQCPSNNTPIVRMNPLVQPVLSSSNEWVLPRGLSVQQFIKLIELDMDAIEDEDVVLIKALCDAWMKDFVPNQAIRAGNNLKCEIGFSRYSIARGYWATI